MGSEDRVMMTPYERGMLDGGGWTMEDVRRYGFSSVEECLWHQEMAYQDELGRLPRLYECNPEYAVMHASYIEGFILGTRRSLRRLIDAERGC